MAVKSTMSNTITIESGVSMSRSHRKRDPRSPQQNSTESFSSSAFLRNLKKITAHPLISGLILLVIPAICAGVYTVITTSIKIDYITKKIDDQQVSIENIEKRLESERLDRIEAMMKTEEGMRTSIEKSKEEMRNYVKDIVSYASPTTLKPTKTMIGALKKYAIIDDFTDKNEPGNITATTLVAYDIYTNEEYTAEQIADQKVLLPYFDGDQEVYFYGELGPTGAWDGDCIINVYEHGKLTFIKEANYDNGKLLAGKQVFFYEFEATQSNQLVWAISNRTNNGDHSEGETRIYKKDGDFLQKFEMDNVAPKDIINVSAFQKTITSNLLAYYCGSISNGLFSDESGTSYMIHFFENGTVKLLYVGNLKNGNFNDNTGNAWYIVKNEDTDYMYYKGYFKNGNIDGSKPYSYLEPPLTLEQIEEIIGNRKFNISLRWDKLGVT